jgi:hypothetical protein
MQVGTGCVLELLCPLALVESPRRPTIARCAKHVFHLRACWRSYVNACPGIVARILMLTVGRGRDSQLDTEDRFHAVQETV